MPKWRVKEHVWLHGEDDDWIIPGVILDGIVDTDKQVSPPTVTLFHPTDPERQRSVPWGVVERVDDG